jgi:hypothetical protein
MFMTLLPHMSSRRNSPLGICAVTIRAVVVLLLAVTATQKHVHITRMADIFVFCAIVTFLQLLFWY